MAKAKQKLQPSAEVIPLLHASCARLKKLLMLCEAEIDTLINDSGTSAVAKARQIQILSRTIQGLQRDWLKYMAILHPDVPVVSPRSSSSSVSQRDIESMSDEELRDEMFKLIRVENEDDEDKADNDEISVDYPSPVIVSPPDPRMEQQENPLPQASFEGPLKPPPNLNSRPDRHESSHPVTDISHKALSNGEPFGNNSETHSEANPIDGQANQYRESTSGTKKLKKLKQYMQRSLKPPQNPDS